GRSLGGAFASGKLHSSGRLTLRSVSSRRADRLPARRAARSRAVPARTDRSARRGLLEPPFRRPLRDGPLREQEERRGRPALEQPGMTRPKAWLSWSSGKDSAWALETVRRDYNIDIVGLLTTVTEGYERVSMHAVREEILDEQTRHTGLPCVKVRIPQRCVNDDYEKALARALAKAREQGVEKIVFGDLFLEDVRRYREERLAGSGFEPVFPLWGQDTAQLAREMIAAGIEATIVCVDPRRLAPSFAGRPFDRQFLEDLPRGVDPCGENGEFHTCVTSGPMFGSPLPVVCGEVVERDGFVFADLRLLPRKDCRASRPAP